MGQLSLIMWPHPLSVCERVRSASGAAGRLGQGRLGNRQCGCWTIGMGRILHLDREGVKTIAHTGHHKNPRAREGAWSSHALSNNWLRVL